MELAALYLGLAMDLSLIFIKRQLKRVKLFEIQKIIRQIRMLNNRKGTDAQLHKSQRKAARLSETLEALKDLNVGCLALNVHQTLQEGNIPPTITASAVQGDYTERARHRVLTNKRFQRSINATTRKGSVQHTVKVVDTSDNVYTQHAQQTNTSISTHSGKNILSTELVGDSDTSSRDGGENIRESEDRMLSSEHDTDYISEYEGGSGTLKTRGIRGKRREGENRRNERLKVSSGVQPVNHPLLESMFMGTLSEDSANTQVGKSRTMKIPNVKKQRMNRPGQRTRQRQWEKHYGAKAKHIQKGSRQKKTRLSVVRGKGKTKGTNSRQKSRTVSSSCALQPQLHPSWEAKRQRKAKEAGIPEFQGQKTVFSD